MEKEITMLSNALGLDPELEASLVGAEFAEVLLYQQVARSILGRREQEKSCFQSLKKPTWGQVAKNTSRKKIV